ncbi:MAG: Holliday junction resolvase RuvX [Alphaproteobacteria bacterium]
MSDQHKPSPNKGRSFQEVDLAGMRAAIGTGDRLLGIDFGDKKIGIAVSDGLQSVASPVETLVRAKKFSADAERLRQIIAERDVRGIVLGWPLQMDGSQGPRCQATIAFARNLRTLADIDLPILLWDERLTSAMVEKFLINDMDMTRNKRRKVVDQMAAVIILQSALDAL